MVCWHNADNIAIPPASRLRYYVTALSCWHAFKGHRLLFMSNPVLSYYSHYIQSNHCRVELIWCISMSQFSLCTFTPFMYNARGRPVSAGGGPTLPGIWDSSMLVSLP